MSNVLNSLLRLSSIVLLITVILSPNISALSQSELLKIKRGSLQYTETTSLSECSSNTIVLNGNSNTEKAYNFFISKGLEPHQSAGIIGNLYAESGIIPTRKQGEGVSYKATMADINEAIRLNKGNSGSGFGIGIAQWTSWNRLENLVTFANENGGSPLSLDIQLQYLYDKELASNGLEQLKRAEDVRQAAWVFLVFFERPAATSGYEFKEQQATSGSAKTELDKRAMYSEQLTRGFGAGSSSGGSESLCDATGAPLTGDESQPSFNAIPSISVDDGPQTPFNESDCTGSFTPGAKSLSGLIKKQYSPPVTSIGGYACRANTAAPTISIHGLGRALDVMIDGTTPNGLETGNRIRNFVINNAKALGIQRVIWDKNIWSADQSGWRTYTGPNPHIDHLHIEINEQASRNANLAGGI